MRSASHLGAALITRADSNPIAEGRAAGPGHLFAQNSDPARQNGSPNRCTA